MIILDTDTLSLIQQEQSALSLRVRARIAEAPQDEWLGTTIITCHEQVRGWLLFIAKAKTKADQVNAYRLLAKNVDDYREMEVIGYDGRAVDRYDQLRKAHRRLGTMDLRIAAIALVRGALLVTRNVRDFREIEGLRSEDWTK